MPELPDLEVFKDNIFKRLTSKRLTGLNVYNPSKVMAPQAALLADLKDRELLRVGRVGKELYFEFGAIRDVAVHLMLSGKIDIVKDGGEGINFKIFSMSFERETLVISDKDGLCMIRYKAMTDDGPPDALAPAFTLEYFLDMAGKKSRLNVKAFLIDQGVVKGIGNAYADEILWAARISPYSLTGKIPEDKLEALYYAAGAVLKNAVISIKRIAPDIISGEERSFLKVHNKKLKETETGYPIIVERIASKITYFTKEQVEYS